MSRDNENELEPELLGFASLQSFASNNSSPRIEMARGHLSQSLTIEGATHKRIQTGKEIDLGRYTFQTKLDCDAIIVDIIEKYPKSYSFNGFRDNPLTTVIYENLDTGVIDFINISSYHSKHQHFGFKFVENKEAIERLLVGAAFPKDTIFSHSPNVTKDLDGYKFGLEANVAFMSDPGVIEDGVIVSKSFVEKMKTKIIENRSISWGKTHFPLNLYGDSLNYKPFPDIGDPIRDDGLVFATREFDEDLGVINLLPSNLRIPDYNFDILVYGEPNAKVIDIDIKHNTRFSPSPTPVGMEEQTNKYYQAILNYFKRLIECEHRLIKNNNGRKPVLSSKLHSLMVEATIFKLSSESKFSKQMFKRIPLDNWRVELVYEKTITPKKAFKITDGHGGKGVICGVRDDKDMPVDSNGNVADVIMDGDSVTKRNNAGRLFEQYINATSAHVTNIARKMIEANPNDIENVWNYLINYYKTISPQMYELITSPEYKGTKLSHVNEVMKNGIYIYYPTNNRTPPIELITNLARDYPLNIGPVTYRSENGKIHVTKKPVLIGSIYIILLEKIGKDMSAISTAPVSHFGTVAKLNRSDRNSTPVRCQPVKIPGEAEARLFGAVIGGKNLSTLMHMSNSPRTHREICQKIITADKPTNIDEIVDYSKINSTDNRVLSYINETIEASGIKFEYTNEDSDENL